MENGQPTRTGKESENPADISGDSMKSPKLESMPLGASGSSRKSTTATMRKGSKKIWKSAALLELRSKAGLVAGALADFQTAKGLIVRDEVTYTSPSGRACKGVKLILLVEDADIVAVKTANGLDFNIVAVKE